jgi:phosphate transport system substrate-binding protein
VATALQSSRVHRHGRLARPLTRGTLSVAAGLVLSVAATSLAGASSAPGGKLSAHTTKTPSATLTGVGSSSIEPFYGRVLYQYNKLNKGVTVNYAPSGSGPGVVAVEQNTASFGQSEVPMTAAQQAVAKGPVLQVPVDLGGIALSYHIHGVRSGLKLSGPLLAQIYLRQVTKWNAKAIAALNPKLHLPDENIIPVFRADTSGPGYDLDQYLIDTSSAWATAVGPKASTAWPTSGRASGDVGEQLNSGVAAYVKETEGTIGYVEYSYSSQSKFTDAALLSHSHTYVAPSLSTIANAASHAPSVSAAKFNIVYGPGKSTYPLANFSWAIMYQRQANTTTGIVLGKLFQWITTSGQAYSKSVGYVPLPSAIVALGHTTLLKLETSTGQAIFTG